MLGELRRRRITKHDYAVGLNLTGSAVDDPDVNLFENYACKSERHYTAYCSPQVDKLLNEQSQEADIDKRKRIVWEIERVPVEDAARPIIFHGMTGLPRRFAYLSGTGRGAHGASIGAAFASGKPGPTTRFQVPGFRFQGSASSKPDTWNLKPET